MFAVIYLILLLLLGDALCRRFFKFASGPHRFGAAFLTGALIGSWWTYLCSYLFAATNSPLLWGNLLFFVMCTGLIYWLWANPASQEFQTRIDSDQVGFSRWDWVATGLFLAYACWLTFATFSMDDGKVRIATHQWSDFGSTVSIMQSFANGHNFPTEYPHFSGDRIRYHFLFYFLAGNLEYLGLSPSTANNLLSILSLLSMLFLVMALGVVLFASRLIGRIAACLFFFHGTLSFIPYVYDHWPLRSVIDSVWKMRDFLPSGFNYRGELWGVWSQVVYANQRHLASSIGILLLVMFFLIDRYREAERQKQAARAAAAVPEPLIDTGEDDELEQASAGDAVEGPSEAIPDEENAGEPAAESSVPAPAVDEQADAANDLPDAEASITEDPESAGLEIHPEASLEPQDDAGASGADIDFAALVQKLTANLGRVSPFIFAGALLGLMPMWNGAVFTAAFAILACFFVLFPYRRQLVILGLTTAVFALPQIYYLKSGNLPPGPSLIGWGYTLGNASFYDVFYYLGWTFGVKWLLILIGVIVGTWLRNRVLLAVSTLIAITFCFQFSPEALTNHKFLNMWLVVANLFAAAGIWWLWSFKGIKTTIPGKFLAVVLTATIVIGGIIDLFPIKNSTWMYMEYRDDALVKWVMENTDPNAIFLSNRHVNHKILLAGRRLFYGHPYYAWGAGYPTGEQEAKYKKMLESRDPGEVFSLLKANNISYVAYDNGLRNSDLVKNPNEMLYKAYFPVVFDDTENRYDGLKIYKVPDSLGPPDPTVQLPPAVPTPTPGAATSTAFTGGQGVGGGQFSKPRGIATDPKGNIYVADTGNDRVQKFDQGGSFLFAFGKPGSGAGEMKEPNGVAVDATGAIYVTDPVNHKLMKFTADGTFAEEWKGPEKAFYGPRDLAIGPNKQIYIVDQGNTRIVRFDPVTKVFTSFGSAGNGPGQFLESTGIDTSDRFIFVADNGNNRIQVFDLDGNFVRQWEVPAWERYVWNYPDVVYDGASKLLYVTNSWKNEILAYDLQGNTVDRGFRQDGTNKLSNPTSICIGKENGAAYLLVLNNSGATVSKLPLPSQAANQAP